HRSLSYIDAAILSQAIIRREANVWRSAVDSVILYGQSYKQILMTTLKIWVVGKVFSFVVFIGFVVPALVVGSLIHDIAVIIAVVMAIVAARLLELALYEPFALA